MSELPLSRGALSAVLQSLLTAELRACRGGSKSGTEEDLLEVWPASLWMLEGDCEGACLRLDSLDGLRLSAAANEMFHLYESGHERTLLTARTWKEWLQAVENNWRAGVTRVTFLSSGSTGMPHRCPHEMTALALEVEHLAQLFRGRSRIVSLVQAHHIYGFLLTAMLADRLGIQVVRARGSGESCGIREGDLVVAVPEQWDWMYRSMACWPMGVEGVTSTAACPEGLISGLVGRGLGGMTEIYGSSETAGVGTRRWPEKAYRWMPQWSLAEEEGCILHAHGWKVKLMDRILLSGEDGFLVEGRRDRAVQVGGTNVYPDRVAAMLCALPGVEEAAVRVMRPEEGVRLKAFVVAARGCDRNQLEREIGRWVREHLTVPERPTSWTFGATLPLNAMGKAADW